MTDPKQIDDGGPAFPCETYGLRNGKETTIPTNGMTLRDWFAGQALAGICSQSPLPDTETEAAKIAYLAADAMLAARKDKA